MQYNEKSIEYGLKALEIFDKSIGNFNITYTKCLEVIGNIY